MKWHDLRCGASIFGYLSAEQLVLLATEPSHCLRRHNATVLNQSCDYSRKKPRAATAKRRNLSDDTKHSAALNMTRRKTTSRNLKQQSLIGFLKPDPSKTSSPPSRNDRFRTNPAGPARRRTTTIPLELSEPSGQSDTDSGVDTIHFEPRRAVISDDDDDNDDIQPSSPVKRRRTVTEVESHADHDTSSSDSEESLSANRRAISSIKTKRPIARSPSAELESLPKRRRLARGIRPSTPEESDDLLGEVDEAGNHFTELCKETTNLVYRYYPVSLSGPSETDRFSDET